MDIGLVLPERQEIGAPFRVTLNFVPQESTAAVRARVEGSGVVTVLESGAARLANPVAGGRLSIQATVRIDGVGTGQLSGTVEVVDDADAVQYGRTDSVSVLATSSEVLTGRAGELQLRLDHLDHERALGLVSDTDYVRLRDEILGGGSATSHGS